MIKIYGIKNCDTMKKAFKWFDANDIDYIFHDYKKQGIDENALKNAIAQHGWKNAINTRGTTWRKLPDDVKNTVTDENAIDLAKDNASIIKRPLIVKGNKTYLGFDETFYKNEFLD